MEAQLWEHMHGLHSFYYEPTLDEVVHSRNVSSRHWQCRLDGARLARFVRGAMCHVERTSPNAFASTTPSCVRTHH